MPAIEPKKQPLSRNARRAYICGDDAVVKNVARLQLDRPFRATIRTVAFPPLPQNKILQKQ
jgi:hypothetical protein